MASDLDAAILLNASQASSSTKAETSGHLDNSLSLNNSISSVSSKKQPNLTSSPSVKQSPSNGKVVTQRKESASVPSLPLDFGKMSTEEVFNLTREFIKAKDGSKAIQMSYDDRNMMNVLCKQIKYCKFDPDKTQVGFLDLVGKDRLQLWKSLGDLSREDAMLKYINLVAKVCPLFTAHLEAHKRHLEEQEKIRQKLIEEEERKKKEMAEQKEKKLREEDLKLLEDNKKRREEIQRKQIQEALNQQTYPHFKAYAEQQHPNNAQAQEELIKQLQEQHFEQYMNQVYQQQLLHQQQQAEQLKAIRRAQKKQDAINSTEEQLKKLAINETTNHNTELNNNVSLSNNNNSQVISTTSNSHLSNPATTTTSLESVNIKMVSEKEDQSSIGNKSSRKSAPLNSSISTLNTNVTSATSDQSSLVLSGNQNGDENDDDDNDDDEIELPPISAASMLTRKDIKEFKESVKRDNDAVIRVGSGETVTVRVPTHEDGRLIFWEFATDYYDLGFGLHFEWTISPSNNVTVHVSDSSEDEEAEDEEGGAGGGGGGGEAGAAKQHDIEKGSKANENKPPCDEIIPIFRRDCHEEVYAGSHLYPGRGVYLLKFDNSYSLWRSKTLYYRVYYSK